MTSLLTRRRAPAAAAVLAVVLPAACGREGVPDDPARLLARVPADAAFVASADLAALGESELAREIGLTGAWEELVAKVLSAVENVGLDSAADLERVLVSGDLTTEPPWALVELWGHFDLEGLASTLRGKGLVEGERDGRPAFILESDGACLDSASGVIVGFQRYQRAQA